MKDRIIALLKDNIYTRAFFRNLNYQLHPEEIAKMSPQAFLKDSVRIFLLFLVTYVVCNFLLSFIHLDFLNRYAARMLELYTQKRISWSLYLMNTFPYSILFLAGFSVIFQVYVAIVSFASLWVLGESDRSFARMLGIAFSTGVYVLLSFFPILVLYSIAPRSIQHDVFQMTFYLGLNAAFFIIGSAAQSVFYIRMSRTLFSQTTGRAILTWLGPFLFFVIVFFASV
ncbi:hypothetical protein EHO59_12905 [Leptospira semungkisensis]|uniref:Yip1 domain-containing protein n=1 Tax=Leptospira semungkisensis TaxID=2484985 RepID=A0A4R9FT59_9LEPT|nr:hypothetical protein EHO59_12905 [Leptospira semungkisensis]